MMAWLESIVFSSAGNSSGAAGKTAADAAEELLVFAFRVV
jgi:hypothetical protein